MNYVNSVNGKLCTKQEALVHRIQNELLPKCSLEIIPSLFGVVRLPFR